MQRIGFVVFRLKPSVSKLDLNETDVIGRLTSQEVCGHRFFTGGPIVKTFTLTVSCSSAVEVALSRARLDAVRVSDSRVWRLLRSPVMTL